MAEFFQNLIKFMSLEILQTLSNQSRINIKKTTARHIKMKLLKPVIENLKEVRKKIDQYRQRLKLWSDIFKVLKVITAYPGFHTLTFFPPK